MANEAEPGRMKAQRLWREKTERLQDLEERFAQAKAAAATKNDYLQVAEELTKVRRAYRLEGVRDGKRARGVGVAIHTVMWPVWFKMRSNTN